MSSVKSKKWTKESVLEALSIYDTNSFKFFEDAHKYYLNEKELTSVTTFISQFHSDFNQDEMSLKTAQKRGISKDEVLKEWKDKNDYSKHLGHHVHLWIENYYNKIPQQLPNDIEIIDRINKFNYIHGTHLHKLEHIVSEQKIFSENKLLAGTIDTLFLYKGNVIMLDWKSNLKMTSDVDTTYEKLYYPFNKYYKNHLNEYSIQQSLYALMLEEIGIYVKKMYLCYIPKEDKARMYTCVDMREELKQYFKKPPNKNIDISGTGIDLNGLNF